MEIGYSFRNYALQFYLFWGKLTICVKCSLGWYTETSVIQPPAIES